MRANRLSATCVIALITALATPARRAEEGRHAAALSQRQSASASLLEESTIASVTPVFVRVQQPREVRSRQGA